jgi:hypothetical protein
MGDASFKAKLGQRSGAIAASNNARSWASSNGLGDGAGLIFGMNLAQGMNPQTAGPLGPPPLPPPPAPSLDEQIEAVKKLKELLDVGILTQDEFDAKKKQVMGL